MLLSLFFFGLAKSQLNETQYNTLLDAIYCKNNEKPRNNLIPGVKRYYGDPRVGSCRLRNTILRKYCLIFQVSCSACPGVAWSDPATCLRASQVHRQLVGNLAVIPAPQVGPIFKLDHFKGTGQQDCKVK